MTEKQFFASKWKPFEVMTVYVKDLDRDCRCILIGVEFEDKIMKLRPLDTEIWQDEIFEAPIKVTTRGEARQGLKIIK